MELMAITLVDLTFKQCQCKLRVTEVLKCLFSLVELYDPPQMRI